MFKTKENKDIFKAIHRSQHTQRNYDLGKTMPVEDFDLLVEAATQCPSKQNISFYKAHFITNRKLIEEIHSWTDGFTIYNQKGITDKTTTNSQVLANLLIVFEAHRDPYAKDRNAETHAEQNPDYELNYSKNWALERDQNMAIGIAAGYVNITAAMLGYGTGCCACFMPDKIQEVMGIDGTPMLMMGVGFKQEGVNRRIHHKTGFKFPTLKKQPVARYFWN